MTIKQLIEKLSDMDPELEVYIRGYEDGYDDLCVLEPITVCKNVNTEWWLGKHEDQQNLKHSDEYEQAKGIVLS